MKTKIGMVMLALGLAVVATQVARADGNEPAIPGFEQVCEAHMRDKLCTGYAPAPKPVAKRASKPVHKGPTLGERVAKLEAKLDKKAEAPQGVTVGEVDALRQELADLRKEAADGLVKEREEREQGDAAQSTRTDKHGQMMTDLAGRIDKIDARISNLREKRRPVEFALYAAPLMMVAASAPGGLEVSYMGLTPQLLIPIYGRTSLEFETSLLVGDDKNPFGTFARGGVAYEMGHRAHAALGLGLLMASLNDHLEAELAAIVGSAGFRFDLGKTQPFNYGFDLFLGKAVTADHDQELTMGARALVGIRLPE